MPHFLHMFPGLVECSIQGFSPIAVVKEGMEAQTVDLLPHAKFVLNDV